MEKIRPAMCRHNLHTPFEQVGHIFVKDEDKPTKRTSKTLDWQVLDILVLSVLYPGPISKQFLLISQFEWI